MCFNCGDFIDYCREGSCHNPNADLFQRYRKFWVGDEYCKHLKLKYGHDRAEWSDRYQDEE